MPEVIQAVKCVGCGKLIHVDSAYITIPECSIIEHKQKTGGNYEYNRRPTESVALKDAVACSNKCLHNAISLKGFN